MRILIIRFRQMGDAILTTPLCNTIKINFPNATTDIVLNDKIALLFKNYAPIDNIICFSEQDRNNIIKYCAKVWNIVHSNHYDVIIDMRSTFNTIIFTLFSPSTSFRIGLKKSYTKLFFNHRIPKCRKDENMIDHNLNLLSPLESIKPLKYDTNISLNISDQEKTDFHNYMQSEGIDFTRPIMLAGVTAKLESKTWHKQRMTEILSKLTKKFPKMQIIFNYAPGKEEINAKEIYFALEKHPNIFINIKACNSRQLAAMASNCTFYFGNEGGARHIVHAMQRPSFAICSPGVSKRTWIPQSDKILTEAISPIEIVGINKKNMTTSQLYDAITVDIVWNKLVSFCEQLSI